MAVEMLKMYSRQGIFKKGIADEEYERLVNVGQVLNNAWLMDAEILYEGSQKKKMAYYMNICCGLLILIYRNNRPVSIVIFLRIYETSCQ
jgi:hypothetical protein